MDKGMKINDMLNFTCKKKTAMCLSTTKKNLKRKSMYTCEGKSYANLQHAQFLLKKKLLCIYL